jgi:mono/diheme cytochrome c family protein
MKTVITLLTLVVLGIALGCGSERRAPALVGWPQTDTDAERRGQVVFAMHCYQCHPNGASGLGPALNDKPAPAGLIKTQVRAGLGAMPAFDAQKISDQELDDLAAYVIALRETKPQ